MNIKKLYFNEITGSYEAELTTGETAAVGQVVYVDFDGAENVSYINREAGVEISGISVAASGCTAEETEAVIAALNTQDGDTVYVAAVTEEMEKHGGYSTIYAGDTDAFDSISTALRGIAETTGGTAAADSSDKAFAVTGNIADGELVSVIAHEAGHLEGTLTHGDGSEISDYMAVEQTATDLTKNFRMSNNSGTMTISMAGQTLNYAGDKSEHSDSASKGDYVIENKIISIKSEKDVFAWGTSNGLFQLANSSIGDNNKLVISLDDVTVQGLSTTNAVYVNGDATAKNSKLEATFSDVIFSGWRRAIQVGNTYETSTVTLKNVTFNGYTDNACYFTAGNNKVDVIINGLVTFNNSATTTTSKAGFNFLKKDADSNSVKVNSAKTSTASAFLAGNKVEAVIQSDAAWATGIFSMYIDGELLEDFEVSADAYGTLGNILWLNRKNDGFYIADAAQVTGAIIVANEDSITNHSITVGGNTYFGFSASGTKTALEGNESGNILVTGTSLYVGSSGQNLVVNENQTLIFDNWTQSIRGDSFTLEGSFDLRSGDIKVNDALSSLDVSSGTILFNNIDDSSVSAGLAAAAEMVFNTVNKVDFRGGEATGNITVNAGVAAAYFEQGEKSFTVASGLSLADGVTINGSSEYASGIEIGGKNYTVSTDDNRLTFTLTGYNAADAEDLNKAIAGTEVTVSTEITGSTLHANGAKLVVESGGSLATASAKGAFYGGGYYSGGTDAAGLGGNVTFEAGSAVEAGFVFAAGSAKVADSDYGVSGVSSEISIDGTVTANLVCGGGYVRSADGTYNIGNGSTSSIIIDAGADIKRSSGTCVVAGGWATAGEVHVSGNSSVTVNGGKITNGYIFGGGYLMANGSALKQNGNTSVTVSNGSEISGIIFGGCGFDSKNYSIVNDQGVGSGAITGSSTILIDGSSEAVTLNCDIYGGGFAQNTVGSGSDITIRGTVNGYLGIVSGDSAGAAKKNSNTFVSGDRTLRFEGASSDAAALSIAVIKYFDKLTLSGSKVNIEDGNLTGVSTWDFILDNDTLLDFGGANNYDGTADAISIGWLDGADAFDGSLAFYAGSVNAWVGELSAAVTLFGQSTTYADGEWTSKDGKFKLTADKTNGTLTLASIG